MVYVSIVAWELNGEHTTLRWRRRRGSGHKIGQKRASQPILKNLPTDSFWAGHSLSLFVLYLSLSSWLALFAAMKPLPPLPPLPYLIKNIQELCSTCGNSPWQEFSGSKLLITAVKHKSGHWSGAWNKVWNGFLGKPQAWGHLRMQNCHCSQKANVGQGNLVRWHLPNWMMSYNMQGLWKQNTFCENSWDKPTNWQPISSKQGIKATAR